MGTVKPSCSSISILLWSKAISRSEATPFRFTTDTPMNASVVWINVVDFVNQGEYGNTHEMVQRRGLVIIQIMVSKSTVLASAALRRALNKN
ncbi:hypothetical protein GcM3_059025 [Golovinomyces cichoracearum]|uniref:Uncharacterized protein n=1 Tax=Golovinomyces cichoracearum TaxID=62708 RepID=A0A420IWR2_9PEZI|nr:hypothetical protein GcM3_059025 [Golovinomyces cichoracearum]